MGAEDGLRRMLLGPGAAGFRIGPESANMSSSSTGIGLLPKPRETLPDGGGAAGEGAGEPEDS